VVETRLFESPVKIEKFSDLVVWKEAHKLALSVYELTEQFPARERFGVVAQVRRSAASVCANIAEGYGRRTTRE
jgi:four helix bundle protein